ncbi:MAG: hypothetical protein U0271_21595 [Polyangiaceae bacterium]
MDLRQSFQAARLPIELRAIPLAWTDRRSEDIVQMDIARENDSRFHPERFRIYPGHTTNVLEVVDADRTLRQLVLRVSEAERTFVAHVHRAELEPGARVVGRVGDVFHVEHHTVGDDRSFLMGMDEAHLFIALLPLHAGSISAAHAALKPELVAREEARGARIVRQGEWFFIGLEEDEQRVVGDLARRSLKVLHRVGIAEAIGLHRLGRPHVAEEVMIVRGIPDARGDRGERFYVRGMVQHPDHKTITLRGWHRTVPNLEEITAPIPGVDYLD